MQTHFSEITGRKRLVYGVLVGVGVALLPLPTAWPTQVLLSWCAGSSTFLGLAWWLAMRFDAKRTRERALSQDQSGWMLSSLLLASVFVSVGAIALMLQHVKDLADAQRTAHLALSMLALGASWLLMQTVFAFHYAHLFYQSESRGQSGGSGLQFPGDHPPDYFDFLYYAHVVGMTSQVSDVVVTGQHMRRLTLLHSLLAFAFNMLVLALSINVVAGAMQ